MIIDSHCHLNYEPMFGNLNSVIDKAKKVGIDYLLTISVDDSHYNEILKIVDLYKEVYGTYGIHPHEAKSHIDIKTEDIILKINKNKKIIGIGETGLDFYYNYSDKADQSKLFIEHIKAAQSTNLPLIVHTRSAEKETFDILKSELKNKNFKILIHCFTGSKEFAFKLIDIGAFISASGVITFKKSSELANTFKAIPNDRILVETDAPYLSPVPLRGKPNEPSNIVHTVSFLSKLKNLPSDEFSNITTNNFFNLFGNLNEK